jgi:hypothetical protein
VKKFSGVELQMTFCKTCRLVQPPADDALDSLVEWSGRGVANAQIGWASMSIQLSI